MFPLLELTEGQNGLVALTPKALNDTQYTWNVMGRMSHVIKVISLVTATTYPGQAFQPFEVIFEGNAIPRYYGMTTPDKQNTVRVQSEPERLGGNRYKYKLRINSADTSEYVAAANFVAGSFWVMALRLLVLVCLMVLQVEVRLLVNGLINLDFYVSVRILVVI
jgi:hypothetical protein